MKNVLKSISEAEGGPDGQVLAIYGPEMVRDGPDWTPSINFLLGTNLALVKIVLVSIPEARGGPDGQVWDIFGPHMVRDGPDWTPSIHF